MSVSDGVARITIERTDGLNAIERAAEQERKENWRRLESDRSVRAVVMTGAGERASCVGADMSDEGPSGIEYWATTRPGGFGGIALRTTLDVPVIARVNGYALGGGLEMVLGCDIVIAAEHAEFGFPEVRVGRIPMDGGVATLVRRIPYVWAMDLLLTGRRILADEAARIGLVNRVVPSTELDTAVDAVLQDILACGPLSVRATKQIVQRTAHLSAADAQALRLPAVIESLLSREGEEGVRAFREKRPPDWSGT